MDLVVMTSKQLALILAGVVISLLGLIWFLQGAGFLELCPILCFADCECVSGGSAFWAVAGAIAFVIGLAAVAFALKMR